MIYRLLEKPINKEKVILTGSGGWQNLDFNRPSISKNLVDINPKQLLKK